MGMTKQKALVLASAAALVIIGVGLVIALVVNSDGSETVKHYDESGQLRLEATTNPDDSGTVKQYYESGQLKV